MAEGAKNRAAKVFKINPKLILCLPSVTSHSPPRLFLTECICAQEMFYYVIQHSWYVQLQNSVITNGFIVLITRFCEKFWPQELQ